jgi:hypothetical protein
MAHSTMGRSRVGDVVSAATSILRLGIFDYIQRSLTFALLLFLKLTLKKCTGCLSFHPMHKPRPSDTMSESSRV